MTERQIRFWIRYLTSSSIFLCGRKLILKQHSLSARKNSSRNQYLFRMRKKKHILSNKDIYLKLTFVQKQGKNTITGVRMVSCSNKDYKVMWLHAGFHRITWKYKQWLNEASLNYTCNQGGSILDKIELKHKLGGRHYSTKICWGGEWAIGYRGRFGCWLASPCQGTHFSGAMLTQHDSYLITALRQQTVALSYSSTTQR